MAQGNPGCVERHRDASSALSQTTLSRREIDKEMKPSVGERPVQPFVSDPGSLRRGNSLRDTPKSQVFYSTLLLKDPSRNCLGSSSPDVSL